MVLPVAQKFLRAGDVTAILNKPIQDQWGNVVDSLAIKPEQLKAFADAIRGKEQWFRKILGHGNLAEKWAKEAQLPEDPLVADLVRDLKTEARCICLLDHTIRVTSSNLPNRPVNWAAIQAAVHDADGYLRTSKLGITTPRMYEDVGAYFADDVVPEALHKELSRELDALAAMEPKDFHPGSGGKVQDLIHPSLYPYMAESTPLSDTAVHPPTLDGKFVTHMHEKHESNSDEATMKSAYAWIPSVFTVSKDGRDVSIGGYINGLGTREQYPVLFRVLEQVFKVVMPVLERAVYFNTENIMAGASEPAGRFAERHAFLNGSGKETIVDWKALRERHKEERRREEEAAMLADRQKVHNMEQEKTRYQESCQSRDAPSPTRWAGQTLKVVVKAANYVLEPGQEYGGTWHIEGMPHERIVASAIYYYERDNTIVDAGLYLRRKRDGMVDYPTREDSHRDDFSGSVLRIKKGEEGYSSDDDRQFQDDCDDDTYYLSTAPSDYGSEAGMGDPPAYLNVGVLPTTNEHGETGTGRIVTFPNWVQHRVVSVYNDPSASITAVRKILCFFLVDDCDDSDELDYPGFSYEGMEGMTVLTTSNVPQQARACNLPTLAFLLPIACRRVTHGQRTLPPELVQVILSHVRKNANMEFGMSREDAERRRRELMSDRKVQTQDINGLWETEYSLCEH